MRVPRVTSDALGHVRLLRAGCLYSPSCLEEVFSETRLPVLTISGNSLLGQHKF
jgi:hypothetical protein